MMTPERLAVLKAAKARADGLLFRPSGIARTIACPGSVILALRVPPEARRKSSPEAREGTAAHEVAAQALKNERQPDEWVDRRIDIGDGGEPILVTSDMADGVQTYLDEVAERWEPGVETFVEYRMSLSRLDPSDPLLAENGGTGDCVLVNRARRELTILDLKFGKGRMVAGDAPQLKDYALMGLLEFHFPAGWERIITVVVQPRAAYENQRVKPVVHPPVSLTMDFTAELVGAMERALDVDAPLIPGDHCLWCPAGDAGICPAVRDRAINLARDDFAKVPLFTATSSLPALPGKVFIGSPSQPRPMSHDPDVMVLPSPTDLDPAEVATILLRRPLWETFIAGVEHRAVALIQAGTTVPGWKLVQRSGNRRWLDPAGVSEALLKLGLKANDIWTEPVIRSPAQVEKKLAKEKRDAIEVLVERPLGAPTLVQASDGREAVPALLGAIPEEQR